MPPVAEAAPNIFQLTPHLIGIWVAAFLTFAIYSFLYADNPVYKLAEHLFVGVSAGYSIVIGFWDVVESREPRAPGYLNRRIERKVAELSGVKSLYSDSYYTEDEFWSGRDRVAYVALKARYDPAGALPDLYAKCVRPGAPAAR